METAEDEDDLKLVQASAGLLSDLEVALPKLLWNPSKTGSSHGRVHTQVKRRDLDHVIELVRVYRLKALGMTLIAGNRSNHSKASRNSSMLGCSISCHPSSRHTSNTCSHL